MDYQVWIKDEYEERWTKVDCGDLEAAKREIDQAVRRGGEPILTMEVPYELAIKVMEAGSEVKKDKAKSDKSTRIESDSKVRRGDPPVTPELDQGNGNPGAGDSAGD